MGWRYRQDWWNFIKERVGAFFGSAGEGGNRESWREMAMAAMRRNGFNADDPRQVDAMLDQIMSESGGIPDRNQEIVDMNGTGANAGQGLLQIIPGTFEAYRDPELPNDRTDPWANMNAALRYYRARYGDDLTVMWGHGHGYARGGVLPGFTPGRDVHDFVSPTGGALRLPVVSDYASWWTRAVGGLALLIHERAATGVTLVFCRAWLTAWWTSKESTGSIELKSPIGATTGAIRAVPIQVRITLRS